MIGCVSWLFGVVDAEFTMSKSIGSKEKITIIDCSNITNNNKRDMVFKIFKSDFSLSGSFIPDSTYHAGDFDSKVVAPEFKNKPYLFKYLLIDKSNGVELKVLLQKSTNGEILFSKNYALSSSNQYPFLIHRSISDINKAMGKDNLSWMNKFVILSKVSSSGESQIILSDYTMTYNKTIISGGLNIFPKWANANQDKFYYTDMNGDRPSLYLVDMNSGKKTFIIKSDGMLVCSDVNKNGQKILLTMAPYGQPDIYELTVATNETKKITDYSGIDVSARYGANDNEIIFVSNRSGKANIYKKSFIGPSVALATNFGTYNNTFDYYNNKMVFSSRVSQNAFNIYLLNASSSKPVPLTSSGDNQYPKFLFNSNIVSYVKQQGNHSKIGYINTNNFQGELFDFNGKIQSLDW
jgi:TolB protein